MFTKILQLRGIKVLATDLLESRLKLAKKFGAKWTCVASQLSTLNSQLDSAIIAVPSDAAVTQALQLVRGGGKILLFAHTRRIKSEIGNRKSEIQPAPVSAFRFPLSAFPLDLASICLDEKDLLGSYSADFTLQQEVARLVFSRRLDVRQLITHHFPLNETANAIALAAHPTPDSLKILVSTLNPQLSTIN